MCPCNFRVFGYCFTIAIAIGLSGCADTPSANDNVNVNDNADDNDNTNDNVNDNENLNDNANDNGSPAGQEQPQASPHECDAQNALPTGNVIYPSPGVLVDSTNALFVWRANDSDDPFVRTTLYISDQEAVFENPRFTRQVDSDATAPEHRTRVQLALDSGLYYWGIEISDLCLVDSETQAVRSIRHPATGLGVPFDLRDPIDPPPAQPQPPLLCPMESARQRTTFQWDLQFEGLRQIQVFVSRGGEPSPFDSPLRVFNVFDIAGDELQAPPACYAMTEQDEPLPPDLELNWGVRIETGDRDIVDFSLTTLTGLTFRVEENEAPCGALLGPENETLLTQTTPLEWDATDGNCEDALTSTLFFEFLGTTPGEAGTPQALFDSSIQCEVQPASDPCPINRGRGLSQLNFPGCVVGEGQFPSGVWAWGVEVDDGTDRTELPDSGTAEDCLAARNPAQEADGGFPSHRTFILPECQVGEDCDDGDFCTSDICELGICTHEEVLPDIFCPVEIVFVMDTSGSMIDEAAALCNELPLIVQDIRTALGGDIPVAATLWGVTEDSSDNSLFPCLNGNVLDELGGAIPGDNGTCPSTLSQNEDWASATAIVAANFPWHQDPATGNTTTVRLVIPISDEGPCQGGGTESNACDQADQDSVDNARQAALDNQVIVSPIIASLEAQPSCIFDLAGQLAGPTGGVATRSSSPSEDLRDAVVAIARAAACTTSCQTFAFECSTDEDCPDDNDACNGTPACVGFVCQPGTPLSCDDGNFCTTDSCDPAGGCVHGAVDCNDGNACTGDGCSPASGCFHNPVPGAACGSSEDTACNNPDTCDGAGNCVDNFEPSTTTCEDGLFCTSTSGDPGDPDNCNGLGNGGAACVGIAVDCDDGLFCTGPETCNDTTDTCDSAGDPCPATECNTCQEGTGNCFDPSGTACGDGSDTECDDPDTCDGSGTCQDNNEPTTTTCGDAGAECTNQDFCDGNGGCADNDFPPAGTPCGDGSDTVCDDPDTCDGSGTCQDNNEPTTTTCGDTGTECTNQDFCDGNGGCADNGFPIVGTPCGDGSDTECDDPDTCDGAGTCQDNNETFGTECEDGNPCTFGDMCDDGECSPGSPGVGDCCLPNGSPGCDDLDCCSTVCIVDPFCCGFQGFNWDCLCAHFAEDLCPSQNCVPFCGDGCCLFPENACTCPADCSPFCGDGCCNGDESACTCSADCSPVCGDGCCTGNENSNNCDFDCT